MVTSYLGTQIWAEQWTVAVAIMGNFCLAGSLIFFAYQTRIEAKVSKQILHMEGINSSQQLYLELFKNAELAFVWESGRAAHESLTDEQRAQFKWACVYWFEHIGAIQRMFELDLIAEEDLKGWENTIRDDFLEEPRPGLIHWWSMLKNDYEDSYRNWVHELIGFEPICKCSEHVNLDLSG